MSEFGYAPRQKSNSSADTTAVHKASEVAPGQRLVDNCRGLEREERTVTGVIMQHCPTEIFLYMSNLGQGASRLGLGSRRDKPEQQMEPERDEWLQKELPCKTPD